MFNRDLNDKSMKQKLIDLSDILSIHDKFTTDKLDDKYYGYIYVADMEYADLTLSYNNDWIVKLGEMHENNDDNNTINDFVKTIPLEHVNKIKPMDYLYVISNN